MSLSKTSIFLLIFIFRVILGFHSTNWWYKTPRSPPERFLWALTAQNQVFFDGCTMKLIHPDWKTWQFEITSKFYKVTLKTNCCKASLLDFFGFLHQGLISRVWWGPPGCRLKQGQPSFQGSLSRLSATKACQGAQIGSTTLHNLQKSFLFSKKFLTKLEWNKLIFWMCFSTLTLDFVR